MVDTDFHSGGDDGSRRRAYRDAELAEGKVDQGGSPEKPTFTLEDGEIDSDAPLADKVRPRRRVPSRFYNAEDDGPTKQRPPRSWGPGLKWHKAYDAPESFNEGRVLVVDYIKKTQAKHGMRKVAAQEYNTLNGLRNLYHTPGRVGEPALRVIHVQNADWATRFLLRKFSIRARDDLMSSDFGRWMRYKRPERRGGKPFLTGKTWTTTHDPWRGISRMSFGLDYLKTCRRPDVNDRPEMNTKDKMFELNHYDDDDNPKYGYDVFVQRLSCYIQYKNPALGDAAAYPGLSSPYRDKNGRMQPFKRPPVENLDNGSVIIIFESAQSESNSDTLIAARDSWESRWRRLPFHLGVESHDNISNDEGLTLESMKIIVQDVWRAITGNWEDFIDVCNTHISILEDKIYDGPADESRAPELWNNANMWLKVERIAAIHVAQAHEVQFNFRELTGDSDTRWLEAAQDDMAKAGGQVQDDLVKPTAALQDLMYKSVEIRDSRHSLQLNTSMWRLSWITFIFLPLTFISSFFGMNVDTFQGDPSIKWYFISAVPMMVLVLALWYVIKHLLARGRQTPYQRGIYEEMFLKLALEHPKLWSRAGPRDSIQPRKFLGRLKWRLIRYWNDPGRTIATNYQDSEYDDLGAWARFKRVMTRRWVAQLRDFDDINTPLSTTPSSVTLDHTTTAPDHASLNDAKGRHRHSTGSDPRLSIDKPSHEEEVTFTSAPELKSSPPTSPPDATALPPPSHSEHQLSVPTTADTQRRRRVSIGTASSSPICRHRADSSASSGSGNGAGIMVEEEPEGWLKDWRGSLVGRGM